MSSLTQPQISPELLEEAMLFGDGCTPATAKRLYAVFMSTASSSPADSNDVPSPAAGAPPTTKLTLTFEDYCRIPEITHHPLRRPLFRAAERFPPCLNSPGSLQFVQFVRLFHILSLDGLMRSKIRLVFDVIADLGNVISRQHLADFIARISECEDEDIDYVVDQVFAEIAPGHDGINFASFRDLVVLTDSFVSTVIIPLALHSHTRSEGENGAAAHGDSDGILLEDLDGRGGEAKVADDGEKILLVEEVGSSNRDLERGGVELVATTSI